MPEETKSEGGGGGGGGSYGQDMLGVRAYPDPSRPYSTESSSSSTFIHDNRNRGQACEEMDDDLLLGLCSPLTRGLDWDTSFTSTVDVDAIKAPGSDPKDDKAPLTTIPENWESLVQDRKEQDSSSGSDTASESESESGSNEDVTSSSSTSVDSDTSSDDNEESKDQAFNFSRGDRSKYNSGSESGKKSSRRASGYKSPNLHRTKSPSVSQRNRSPNQFAGRSPLRSPSSPGARGRKRSGGGHHRSFHSPTAARSSASTTADQVSGARPQHSRQDSHESGSKSSRPTKEEICARVFKFGSTTAATASNSTGGSSYNSDASKTEGGSVRHNEAASDKARSCANRTKQSASVKPVVAPIEDKPPDLSEDSDDSCIILDNVPKPKHLQINNSRSIFSEESEYQHKMSALSAAYGKSSQFQSRVQSKTDDVVALPAVPGSSRHLPASHLLEASKHPPGGADLNLSESSDCSSVSSFSSCELSVAEDIDAMSAEPSGLMDLSSPEESTPPPTLEPAISSLSPVHESSDFSAQYQPACSTKSTAKHASRSGGIECGSQTVETGFQLASSKSKSRKERSRNSNVPPALRGGVDHVELPVTDHKGRSGRQTVVTPPVLRDSADEVPQHRGRPRKNPPMLKPAVNSDFDSDHYDCGNVDDSADVVVEKRSKKKDKLSVFYSMARQRRNKSSSRERERDLASHDIAESVTNQLTSDEDRGRSHKETDLRWEERMARRKQVKDHKQRKDGDKEARRKGKKHRRAERNASPDSDEEKRNRRKHKNKRERKRSAREECFECDAESAKPLHDGHRKRPASSIGIARSSEPTREETVEDRPASTQPTPIKIRNEIDSDTKSGKEMQSKEESTISIVKPQFLSIFTTKSSDKMVNHFASSDPNSVLVFPRKFCTLKLDKFWKKKKVKANMEESKQSSKKTEESEDPTFTPSSSSSVSALPPSTSISTQQGPSSSRESSSSSSVFATKAAVKELPTPTYTGGGTQLQQMLKALAATSSAPKRKKRGGGAGGSRERKNDREERESSTPRDERGGSTPRDERGGSTSREERGGSVSREERGGSTSREDKKSEVAGGEEVVSEDDESLSNRRRKRLGWKSKHKNVVDPVFLGELEHLMQDFGSCRLDRKISSDIWPDRPSSCMPSIFKRRRIVLSRKRREQGKIGKKVKSVRSAACAQEATSPGDDEAKDEEGRGAKGEGEGGSSEQRLPLKKRHHHLQDAGAKDDSDLDEVEIELEIHVSPKKGTDRKMGGEPRKQAAVDKKPVIDKKQTGTSDRRMADVSVSADRKINLSPETKYRIDGKKAVSGAHDTFQNNQSLDSSKARSSGDIISLPSKSVLPPGQILSPSKLPNLRHLEDLTFSQHRSAYTSARRSLVPDINTAPKHVTPQYDNAISKNVDNGACRLAEPARPLNCRSAESAGSGRRPTVADRLAEKLGIPIKPETSSRIEQESVSGKAIGVESHAAASIQDGREKNEDKHRDTQKSSRSYKVQSLEDSVPGDIKPSLVTLAEKERQQVQTTDRQVRKQEGQILHGQERQPRLGQHESEPYLNRKGQSVAGPQVRQARGAVTSHQDLALRPSSSIAAGGRQPPPKERPTPPPPKERPTPVVPPKSPRYVNPGIRSHSSQGFRSPERGARSRLSLERSKPGRGAAPQGGGSTTSSTTNTWDRWKHRDEMPPVAGSSHSFVDSIQDCIDKYTFVDELEIVPPPQLHSRFFTSPVSRTGAAAKQPVSPTASHQQPQQSHPARLPEDKSNRQETRQDKKKHSATPEEAAKRIGAVTNHEGDKIRGAFERDSGGQEDARGKVNECEAEGVGGKSGSYLYRNSRQDLHSHLWGGEERYKKSAGLSESTSNIPKDALMCSFTSLEKTKDITMQMSKPLPTEPIRRVDLGFSHKPLDKSMRFHRGQECYIKKVPQAIVAPFRRHPPESSSPAVTPIHRASIVSNASSAAGISVASSVVPSSSSAVSSAASSTASTSPPSVSGVSQPAVPVVQDQVQTPANASKPGEESEPPPRVTEPVKPVDEPTSEPLELSPQDKPGKSEENKDQNNSIESFIGDREAISKMKKCQVEVTRLKDKRTTQPVTNFVEPAQEDTSTTPTRLRERRKTIEATESTEPSKPDPKENLKDKSKLKTRDEARSRRREKLDGVKETGEKKLNPSSERLVKDDKTMECISKLVGATDKSLIKKSRIESLPDEKIRVKKRKRRQNKTGFPSVRHKKKRIRVEELTEEKEVQRPTIEIGGSDLNDNNATPDECSNFIDSKLLQSSLKKIEKNCKRVSSFTENLRPKRFKADTSMKSDTSSGARSSSSQPATETVLTTATSTVSNGSSVDPSPASSDVESSDVRMSWDDESDQDSLGTQQPAVEESSANVSPSKRKRRSNMKKTYLKAGLFSFDYKSLASPTCEADAGNKLKSMVYKSEEHPFSLLPPPYYCGRQLRQKKEDFALPFDIWSLHVTGTIPSRDVLTTWNYKRIKSNIYYDIKQPSVNYETPLCHCKPKLNRDVPGCLDDCINRMTYTECDPTCRLGSQCTNNAIQKHSSQAVIERYMTVEKGFGIRTKTALPPGSFIMEYVGEVVTDKEFKKRMSTEYKNDNHHYCLHLGEGLVIDGHRMGGECRFVNHSCQPNCEMQKWSVNGVFRMALFSSRYLSVDEELTYDYNFSLFNPHEGQECKCQSAECRGVIGGKSQRVRQQKQAKSQKSTVEEKKTEKDALRNEKKSGKSDKIEKVEDKEPKKDEHPKSVACYSKSSTGLPILSPVKQMSVSQKKFCRENSVLLCRNLEKIRKLREKYLLKVNQKLTDNSDPETSERNATKTSHNDVLQELPGITVSSHNSGKVIKLAKNLNEILKDLRTFKSEDGQNEYKFLYTMSEDDQSKLKLEEKTDLVSIEKSLADGKFSSVNEFDQAILSVFQNCFRIYGSNSPVGQAALSLRSKYIELSEPIYNSLKEDLGPETSAYAARRPDKPADSDEDIIICPCRQYKDEGMMIQCENCGIWQHLDCVHPGVDPESLGTYTCAKCSSDKSNLKLDIPLVPQPEYISAGETHYASLLREDNLHLYVGMTVYVLRAFKDKNGVDAQKAKDENIFTGPGGVPHKSISPIKGPSKEAASLAPSNYPTYKTVDCSTSTSDMDIFRVERLWKNELGAMFAFGYHFLRPHETFHEPSRKFFDNEVFRVPLYEVLPLDSIWRECWVLEPAVFSRGRPLASQEEHVYICEYRVDKTARLFNKLAKGKDGTCTKFFAFHNFDIKLKTNRTFTPHKVPGDWIKTKQDKDKKAKTIRSNKKYSARSKDSGVSKDRRTGALAKILVNLLQKQGDKNPLDLSNILTSNPESLDISGENNDANTKDANEEKAGAPTCSTAGLEAGQCADRHLQPETQHKRK